MKKIYLILLILVSFSSFSEETVLSPVDIVNLLLNNNSTIKLSNSGTNLAKNIYDQVINSSKPNVSFTTDTFGNPLAGYNNLVTNTDTYTVSGGLTYKQLLPTGGNLNLNVKDTFNFLNDSTDIDINQKVSIDLTVYQPIFIDNKVIDLDVSKNSKRSSFINYNLSKIDEIDTKNQIITGVLSSIHMVNILKSNIKILNKTILLSEKRVLMAQEDRLNGRISTSDLLSIELNVGKQKETLFDLSYQLEISELNLGRVLGIEDISNYVFDLELLNIKNDLKESTLDNSFINFNEYRAQLKLEKSELDYSINRISEAPLFTMFLNSSTKNLDDGLDMNVNFGVAFQMNILDGGVVNNSLERDKITIDIAKNNLLEAKKVNKENSKVLNYKLLLLEEKLNLLKANMEYDIQLLEREKDLQTLGVSTILDVELVELDLLNRENDITNLYGELYLTKIQIVSNSGLSLQDYMELKE